MKICICHPLKTKPGSVPAIPFAEIPNPNRCGVSTE